MEIEDISKVTSRKRINADVKNLRDKVSRETETIIKLQVAQDTAYWDLREKLQQVEGNHERLQQNMVEVQMQHETISGQYQEELRLRPDTLNKLCSSLEISEVLQEYSERLKDSLSRCKADQATLCDAYQSSGQVIRDLKQKQLQANEKNSHLVTGLEEKVKLMSDQKNRFVEFFTAFKQQAESRFNDLKATEKVLRAHVQEYTRLSNEQKRLLDQNKFDLQKKEEIIASMQKDLNQYICKYNAQGIEIKNIIQQKEKNLKELLDTNKELKEALVNQEQYLKSVCDQNDELMGKVAAMEENHEKAASMIREMKTNVAEATVLHDGLKKEIATLMQEKERFKLEITNKDSILTFVVRIDLNETKNMRIANKHAEEIQTLREQLQVKNAEIENITSQITSEITNKDAIVNKNAEEIETLMEQLQLKNNEIEDITSEFEKYRADIMVKLTAIEELKTVVANELNESEQIKRDYEIYKNTAEVQIQELANQLELKHKEIDTKNRDLDLKGKELDLKTKELDSKDKQLDSIKEELDLKNKDLVSKEKEFDSMTNTITTLVSEIKIGTDMRSNLELTLQRLKQDTERERQLEQDKQNTSAKRIEYLKGSVKEKDESLSKHMSIIKEMRQEKERLHEKIQAMENKMNNIQKELTGRLAPQPADPDDNAVMLSPSCFKKDAVLQSRILEKSKETGVPRASEPPKKDDLPYHLFSDMSNEDETIDTSRMKLRFPAISQRERVSPRPFASLKRRSQVPVAHGGPKAKPTTSDQGSVSQARENLPKKERQLCKNPWTYA